MPVHSVGDVRWEQTGVNEGGDPMYERKTVGDGVLEFEEMTKDEIQQLLRDRDLPVSGNKEELIARLNEAS